MSSETLGPVSQPSRCRGDLPPLVPQTGTKGRGGRRSSRPSVTGNVSVSGGPMYQRIIAVVATALFALLAVVGAVMTDLHDRSYPQQLEASSALYLDFSSSDLPD